MRFRDAGLWGLEMLVMGVRDAGLWGLGMLVYGG